MDQSQAAQDTGISDVAFDVMTLLANKLEAIQAMDIYLEDAEEAGDQEVVQLLNQFRQNDTQAVHQLRGMLVKRLQQSGQ